MSTFSGGEDLSRPPKGIAAKNISFKFYLGFD